MSKETDDNAQDNQERNRKVNSLINYEELYLQEKALREHLQIELEIEKEKVRALKNMSKSKSKTRECKMCMNQKPPSLSKQFNEKEEDEVIEDLKAFSQKLSSVLKIPSPVSFINEGKQPSFMSASSEINLHQKKHLSMIQNFAIFGINQAVIQVFAKEGKPGQEFQGEILYEKKMLEASKQAARLVFPSGMAIKKVHGNKANEKTIELMSYCYTNLKSFILSFENPINNFDEQYHSNDLLNRLNPERRLFSVCIGIHDYTLIPKQKLKLNVSLDEITSEKSVEGCSGKRIASDENAPIGPMSFGSDSIKTIESEMSSIKDLTIGITQRVFCIMSYFPFFSFYEDLLRNLINNIKMERLAFYKHNQENISLTIKQTDSKFQLERMKELFNDCFNDICHKKIQYNRTYELKLINQQKITLTTDWNYAKSYFIDEWIFSILSMFNYDTFIDLFTLVMLEDRIVFICENSNILTHCIYLFANVLLKPFHYAFPVVNIIPNQEEFLNAPFPVLYGMLRKRKHIQEKCIVQRFDNTYVFLTPEKVQILYNEDRKNILKKRPTKLHFLKENFSKIKKFRKKDTKSTKYQIQTTDYCVLATYEEKEAAIEIVSHVNEYISEEIAKKLPNQIEIENMRKKIDEKSIPKEKDEHSYLMSLISANIKKTSKEAFVDKFLDTQMVNIYLFK